MRYVTIDDWLDEIENGVRRGERIESEIGPNATTWLETAWRLGAEREREAIKANKAMEPDVCAMIRALLTNHGVPVAGFLDDHVANAICQRNVLAECLVAMLLEIPGGDFCDPQEVADAQRAISDAALAKAYPLGIETKLIGEAVRQRVEALPPLDRQIAKHVAAMRKEET